MNDDLQLLRNCLSDTTHALKENWRELRRLRRWDDFALEYRDRPMDPTDLAAYALEHLIADTPGTMNRAIMLGVTRFLIAKSGRRDESDSVVRQRLKDLDQITQNPANFVGYLAWAQSWFD